MRGGADPCVFYKHLTKLLNLIALLGIIPSCGVMTPRLCGSLFFRFVVFRCLDLSVCSVSIDLLSPQNCNMEENNLMFLPTANAMQRNWFRLKKNSDAYGY